MDCYYLNTLILFFRSQKDFDYTAIEDILAVIDSDQIPENRERDIIIDILRAHGLNETSYRNGRFSPASDRSPAEYGYEKVHNVVCYPLEAIRFPVLNGTIGINIPLN